MKSEFPNRKDKHIAIVGGGVAGSTAAIHFAELGFKVSVIEKGVSLVNEFSNMPFACRRQPVSRDF